MSLPTQTLASIKQRQIAHYRTSFRGIPLGDERFLGRLARAQSLGLFQLHGALEQINIDLVPSAQSSSELLTAWAEELGLPDGQGGFGRLLPVAASGGGATLTGVKGTVYPAGLIATAEDGVTQIVLTDSVTIPGSPPGLGSVAGSFNAVTPGAVGNLPVGSVLTWLNPPANADATFRLTSALGHGLDGESNDEVFARIVARLQNPPRGGVTEDYHIWAAVVSGAVGIWVYPKRSGTGTVDVIVTTGGSGQGRIPSDSLVQAVQDAIDASRPAGAEAATALAPVAPDANGHVVVVQVTPFGTANEFDWDSTLTEYKVAAYTAGASPTLELNTLAPDSLKSAITAYQAGVGQPPRLQVISTGSVINAPIGCTAYSDSGGHTTLTLQSPPEDWTPPTVNDHVYAYGPVVASIAESILESVDALGPSRACGFADNEIVWDDKLTISSIIAAAQTAVGADGSSLVAEVPVDGVLVDGSIADIEGDDNGRPELLWLKSIAIVQTGQN